MNVLVLAWFVFCSWISTKQKTIFLADRSSRAKKVEVSLLLTHSAKNRRQIAHVIYFILVYSSPKSLYIAPIMGKNRISLD